MERLVPNRHCYRCRYAHIKYLYLTLLRKIILNFPYTGSVEQVIEGPFHSKKHLNGM